MSSAIIGSARTMTLNKPLARGTSGFAMRTSIVCAMLQVDGSDKSIQHLLAGLEPYFKDWYDEQCHQTAQKVAANSHSDIIRAISYIQDAGSSHVSVRAKLRANTHFDTPETEERIDACITLATRLFSVIGIGHIEGTFMPGRRIPWSGLPDKSIKEQVNGAFSKKFEIRETVRLPRLFNAMNLEKMAGIKVCWSSNLADHLLMKEDDTQVTLFHQVSFLKLHKSSPYSMLDPELIDETIATLALLLPRRDKNVQKWFGKIQNSLNLDIQVSQCGHLNTQARKIENFAFWRDRLVILRQAFDELEPRGMFQLWHDDRKKVQWYTFWVAVLVLMLTLAFGFLQTVTGIVQAWAAIKALH